MHKPDRYIAQWRINAALGTALFSETSTFDLRKPQRPVGGTASSCGSQRCCCSSRLFKEDGLMWSQLNEGTLRLKACSAALISHHPVPSGCCRLAWEQCYNSRVRLMSLSPQHWRHLKPPDSTGTDSWAAECVPERSVKLWFWLFFLLQPPGAAAR